MGRDDRTVPLAVHDTGPPDEAIEDLVVDDPALAPPRRIGRYELLEKIGAGGMGWVFSAFDPELDRRIAIKLVKPGRDGHDDERARLLREAQALAQLTHPNVVRIFDAGTAGDRVYLAMELLSGVSLREWLRDEPPPGWREIVGVFAQAARGLAAAHAAGIVHRDFKPSNVSVEPDGTVRVIDFGLAHAAPGRPPTIDTVDRGTGELESSWDTGADRLGGPLTQAGFVMGTPAYMAPEQHRGAEIDASCDQYALCVALYHALFGVLPYPVADPASLLFRKAREDRQPPVRGREVPGAIRRAIARGLRADPGQRWPSMTALVDALQRGRRGRRWWPWIAAGAGVVALGAWAARPRVTIAAACDPDGHLDRVWDDPTRDAVATALDATTPGFPADTWARTSATIDEWSTRWNGAYVATCRPDVGAVARDLVRLCLVHERDRLAATLDVLRDGGREALTRAIAMTHALPSPAECTPRAVLNDPWPLDPKERHAVAEVRRLLVRAHALEDAGRYADALVAAERAREAAAEIDFEPLHIEATYQVGSAESMLAHHDRAVPLLTEAVHTAQAADHGKIVLDATIRLAFVVGREQNQYDEGIRWVRSGLAYLDRLELADYHRAPLLNSLGAVLDKKGDVAEAESLYREAIALWEGAPEPDPIDLATGHNNLGLALYGLGRYDDAIAQYEQVVALREDVLGPMHPDTGVAHSNLSNAYAEVRRLDDAEEHQQRAYEIWTTSLGHEHPYVGASLHNLGMIAFRRGDLDEAEKYFTAAIDQRELSLDPEHPDLASTYLNLGAVVSSRGDQVEAGRLFEKATRILTAALGPEHSFVMMARGNLVETWRLRGMLDEALAGQQDILQIRERTLRPDHPEIAKASLGLGYILVDLKRWDEAAAAIERAIGIYERNAGDPTELARARFMLAQAVVRSDRERAMALAQQAIDEMARFPEVDDEAEEIRAWMRRPLP